MGAFLKPYIKSAMRSVSASLGPHRLSVGDPRLWILMYHRILPKEDKRFALEEPGMVVHPDTFQMQLRELKRHFDLVSLSGWLDARDRGEQLPKRACAVTFDDGWQDNYQYALPILESERVPATLFAVAEKIGTDFQFWPNIVAGLLAEGHGQRLAQHPTLAPVMAELDVSGGALDREQTAKCIGALKKLTDAEVFAALESLDWRRLCGDTLGTALMSWSQLKAMQDSGWVTIGSHTCSHQRLTQALSNDALEQEVVESKRVLQENLGKPVDLFCFPNGDYDPRALKLVREHYRAAVTTRRGINQSGRISDHELTRIGIHNDVTHTARLFSARLSGWV